MGHQIPLYLQLPNTIPEHSPQWGHYSEVKYNNLNTLQNLPSNWGLQVDLDDGMAESGPHYILAWPSFAHRGLDPAESCLPDPVKTCDLGEFVPSGRVRGDAGSPFRLLRPFALSPPKVAVEDLDVDTNQSTPLQFAPVPKYA
jgi:hypothetical protein